MGLTPQNEILLTGPKGSGKSLVVKELATKAFIKLIEINGLQLGMSDCMEMQQLLNQAIVMASQNQHSIILIDDIQSIAFGQNLTVKEEDTLKKIFHLTQFFDQIKQQNTILIAICPDSRSLDPYFRDKFAIEIQFELPDYQERIEILSIHTKKMKLGEDINIEWISEITNGFVASEIVQLCSQAVHECIRSNIADQKQVESLTITKQHFIQASTNVHPKNRNQMKPDKCDLTFANIGGLEEQKKILKEAVDLQLAQLIQFPSIGIDLTKLLLLYGPSGCGKTLLVKAVANECKANIIAVDSNDLARRGMSCENESVSQIFERAKNTSPCIVFMDNIDGLCVSPSYGVDAKMSDRVFSELLFEIDNVKLTNRVIVIGATDRPHTLDQALLKPFRTNRFLYIPLPDKSSRKAIFEELLSKVKVNPNISIEFLACLTQRFSGGELNQICQDAIKASISEANEEDKMVFQIERKHFEMSLGGARKNNTSYDLEKFYNFRRVYDPDNIYVKSQGVSLKWPDPSEIQHDQSVAVEVNDDDDELYDHFDLDINF